MTEPTTSTTEQDVDPCTVADRYVALWREPDAGRRRDGIIECWADGGVEYVEGILFRGVGELETRIAHAYDEFVGSGRYRVVHAGDVVGHGRVVIFTIQLVGHPGGSPAWAARVFLVLDGQGRILEDYQLTVQPFAA